jgi:hypothetical protein
MVYVWNLYLAFQFGSDNCWAIWARCENFVCRWIINIPSNSVCVVISQQLQIWWSWKLWGYDNFNIYKFYIKAVSYFKKWSTTSVPVQKNLSFNFKNHFVVHGGYLRIMFLGSWAHKHIIVTFTAQFLWDRLYKETCIPALKCPVFGISCT